MRDYQLVTPSLDGILRHDSIVYEGLKRPQELLRVMDRRVHAESSSLDDMPDAERKVIDDYFTDIYGLFMKKLSFFIVDSEIRPDDTLKLQALLQEMIKIKRLMAHARMDSISNSI